MQHDVSVVLLCYMDKYPVPLELQGEEKIVGGYISARQFGYIILAALLSPLTMKLSSLLLGPLVRGLPDLSLLPAIVGGLVCLVIWAVLMCLAFVPAGYAGLAPGPKESYDSDPWTPKMRLDQWLLITMRHRRKTHVLPYKRGEAK